MESFAITLLVAVLFTGVVVLMIFVQFLAIGRESHDRFREIMDEVRALSDRVNALAAAGPAPAGTRPEEKPGKPA